MGSLFSDIGSGIESAYDYLVEPDDGSTVPEYDPDTGEPVNTAAKKAVAEWERKYEGGTTKDKAIEALGKLQKFPGPEVLAQSRMLGADRVSSAGVRDFGKQQSPYAAPSYLTGSVDYNKMVAKMMEGLLRQRIRKVDIRTLV